MLRKVERVPTFFSGSFDEDFYTSNQEPDCADILYARPDG